jgi:Na+-transporting NADH:ubiquinone oxidoreductase subunit C
MSSDSTPKTLLVALGVCLVCSVLVSTAAITLKRKQRENQNREKVKNVLEAAELLDSGRDPMRVYQENVTARILDVANGRIVPESETIPGIDPERFDITSASRDPDLSRPLASVEDPAGIKRVPRYMVIYVIMDRGEPVQTVFPVYGKGLWSTMYALIALDRDLETVRGFTVYEHGETPGLGGEVDNPGWKGKWKGKSLWGSDGSVGLRVIKGMVGPDDPDVIHRIDGLSGATLTARGVDRMIRFWFGDNGYGPYIRNLREER